MESKELDFFDFENIISFERLQSYLWEIIFPYNCKSTNDHNETTYDHSSG